MGTNRRPWNEWFVILYSFVDRYLSAFALMAWFIKIWSLSYFLTDTYGSLEWERTSFGIILTTLWESEILILICVCKKSFQYDVIVVLAVLTRVRKSVIAVDPYQFKQPYSTVPIDDQHPFFYISTFLDFSSSIENKLLLVFTRLAHLIMSLHIGHGKKVLSIATIFK